MKKILVVSLILCISAIGISISIYSDSEIDFNGLLKGEKVISTMGSYGTGKSDLNPQFSSFLEKLADFLKENPGLIIEVGGHTDNSGTPTINQKLSLNRAKKVKEYLARKGGIKNDRIIIKGYSSAFPIADNNTKKGRAMNRRIEILAVKNADPAGRLTYIRRDVFTKSPDKTDFARAIINQDLFHLYRVLTRQKSNANVTFQDLSKINLGPESLMIMYSLLERGLPLPRKQNVQLMTGGLRTKLDKLKGKLQVETPSCIINSNSVEIIIGINREKTSALSVFDGKSEVKAQGENVAVPEGYGTIVEMGQPPAPPEPLPEAPQLLKPIESEIHLTGKQDTSKVPVVFQWHRVEDEYHLQVAIDSGFDEIIEDQRLRDNTAALSLGKGSYYWRVAAINKRGIEGYSAQSFFAVKSPGRQSDLPLEITPGPRAVTETLKRSFTVYGKTAAGAQITVKGQPFQTNEQGEFSGAISLHKGWNQVKVRAIHPDFKEKVVWLTFYRHALSTNTISIGLRFDYAVDSDTIKNAYTFQVGKTFSLGSIFESEFSLGLTKLGWKNFPADYKMEAVAIPLTAYLRLMLSKGKVIPFFGTGAATYLTFTQKRGTNKNNTMFFISPEIGGGVTFPFFDYRARLELKYAPFLKKEPFYREMTQRLAFILNIMLKSRYK